MTTDIDTDGDLPESSLPAAVRLYKAETNDEFGERSLTIDMVDADLMSVVIVNQTAEEAATYDLDAVDVRRLRQVFDTWLVERGDS